MLVALGLDDSIRAGGARIDFLKGISVGSGRRALDVDYRALNSGASAWGIHRALLFRTLYDAAHAEGIAIETGRTVIGHGDGRLTFADGSRSPRFACIVDALGAHSPLGDGRGRPLPYGALWATLDWPEGAGLAPDALDQRYRCAREMAGVIPIGRHPGTGRKGAAFFWSVRDDALEALHEAGAQSWKAAVRALWPETEPLLAQIASTRDLVFARYAHRTQRRAAGPQIAHVGDAWHSTSPQLGQGANMALLDAAALAAGFSRHADVRDALAHYAWLRGSHVRLYQTLSRVFTPLYQADDALRPLLRDLLVHHFARIPPAPRFIATLVSGGLGWPLRQLGIEPAR